MEQKEEDYKSSALYKSVFNAVLISALIMCTQAKPVIYSHQNVKMTVETEKTD